MAISYIDKKSLNYSSELLKNPPVQFSWLLAIWPDCQQGKTLFKNILVISHNSVTFKNISVTNSSNNNWEMTGLSYNYFLNRLSFYCHSPNRYLCIFLLYKKSAFQKNKENRILNIADNPVTWNILFQDISTARVKSLTLDRTEQDT